MQANPSFGERLRKARTKRGMSGSHLARLAELSAVGVWQIEVGHHQPMLGTAIALADALGVSLDALCGRKPSRISGRA